MPWSISWDDAGKRLYETGTDRGVLYPVVGANAATDGKAYTGGVAWNGLTGFTESPEGAEANAIYADNIKYLNLRSAVTTLPSCFSISLGWFCSLPPVQGYGPLSIVLQAYCLLELIP